MTTNREIRTRLSRTLPRPVRWFVLHPTLSVPVTALPLLFLFIGDIVTNNRLSLLGIFLAGVVAGAAAVVGEAHRSLRELEATTDIRAAWQDPFLGWTFDYARGDGDDD